MAENLIDQIVKNVVQGRRDEADEGIDGEFGQPGVVELVEQAMQEGVDTNIVLIDGLSRGMTLVGEKYEAGEYFIPDMLTAAEAVEAGMRVMEPYLLKNGQPEGRGKVVMATVKGDLHDIGKNLVCIMLKGVGFSVVDLGIDVTARRIAEAVQEEQASLVGLSALLNTTMQQMRKTIEELEQKNLRDRVKVMIGGAPTSEEFARQIGADGYGKDAFAAVRQAEKLLNKGGDH